MGSLDVSGNNYASSKIRYYMLLIAMKVVMKRKMMATGLIYLNSDGLTHTLKTESTTSGHRRGYNSKRVVQRKVRWSKVQLNMDDQELRLKQLQNHINAIEITITGLTNMSRETLKSIRSWRITRIADMKTNEMARLHYHSKVGIGTVPCWIYQRNEFCNMWVRY